MQERERVGGQDPGDRQEPEQAGTPSTRKELGLYFKCDKELPETLKRENELEKFIL